MARRLSEVRSKRPRRLLVRRSDEHARPGSDVTAASAGLEGEPKTSGASRSDDPGATRRSG